MSEICIAFRPYGGICRNGFVQKRFCTGHGGCVSCGHIRDEQVPDCLKEEPDPRFLTHEGRPRLAEKFDGP